jgi:glutaredoxin
METDVRVKVFSMKGCPHCENLKNKLNENNIDYIDIDIDEHEELYNNFSKKVNNEYLPAILMDRTAFVPERSFNTIDEAVSLIKNQLLSD